MSHFNYSYDGWNLIGDYDASGNELARYIHGPQSDETRHEGNAALDSLKANLHANGGTWLPGRKRCQLLAKISTTGAVYFTQDGNQNVTTITDATGTVVERYTYDVYGTPSITDAAGNVLTISGQGNRFMFTGRETSDWREEVGLCSSTAREGERRGHARVQYIAEIGLYDYRNRVYSATLGRFLQTDPIRFQAGDINIYRYCGNSPVNETDPDGEFCIQDILDALKELKKFLKKFDPTNKLQNDFPEAKQRGEKTESLADKLGRAETSTDDVDRALSDRTNNFGNGGFSSKTVQDGKEAAWHDYRR